MYGEVICRVKLLSPIQCNSNDNYNKNDNENHHISI